MKAMTVYWVPYDSFLGKEPPRSDTLFGAICWAYRLLFGEQQLEANILNPFADGKPPLLLSSMFSYIEKEQRVIHELPSPLSFPEVLQQGKPTLKELCALKTIKKKRFIQEYDGANEEKFTPKTRADSKERLYQFSNVLAGQHLQQYFYDVEKEKQEKQGEQTEPTHTDPFLIYNGHVQRPHSAINRLTGAVEGSRFFYSEEFLASSSGGVQPGLFFCLKCEERLAKNLKTACYFLADKGIGGKASVGKGHAKALKIVERLPYREPDDATHLVTLSLTCPDRQLLAKLNDSLYELERRQGKLESMYLALGEHAHIWKDHVLMLKEGSVFPKIDGQTFYGNNPVVRKDDGKLGFAVQQYGYAFTVKTKHITSLT